MCSPRCSTHASASWPAATPFSAASSLTRSASLRFSPQVLAREARPVATEVALVELVGRAEPTRQEAASERRVGDERDAELLQRRQDLGLDVARPQRVLRLHRRDRVHSVRAADRLGARLGEAEVAHLAGRHELGHRAHRLLDRRVGVDAVLVVEVDVIDAEAPERALARAAHVGRRCRRSSASAGRRARA